MSATAIFDIGKTNKKFVVFNEDFQPIHQEQITIPEIKDDDGYPCDDLPAIEKWIDVTLSKALSHSGFKVTKLNFSTYGATIVNLGKNGKPVTPMYNYLKPYPDNLLAQFLDEYGGHEAFSTQTASPLLGMLNSGLQIYWLKYRKPHLFKRIDCSLHLPQYFSYLFTGKKSGEYTTVGCHSGLYDFKKHRYHQWTEKEGMINILPSVKPASTKFKIKWNGRPLEVGSGINDTSANLVPYLQSEKDPFMLLSTGTWNIAMYPFSEDSLKFKELQQDCLYFLRDDGKPVKVARLFMGNEYRLQIEEMTKHFNKRDDYHTHIKFDRRIYERLSKAPSKSFSWKSIDLPGILQHERPTDYQNFGSFEEAYHQLLAELVDIQADRIRLARGTGKIKKLFVDGGFVENDVFMCLLKINMPGLEVVPGNQIAGSARGAAMVMGDSA